VEKSSARPRGSYSSSKGNKRGVEAVGTIAEIARRRRQDFREILRLSRALDASQEKVEREIKRLISRKRAVPEVADAQRVLALISETNQALGGISDKFRKLVTSWGAV